MFPLSLLVLTLGFAAAGPHGNAPRRRHHFRAVKQARQDSAAMEKTECDEGAWQCIGHELKHCSHDIWYSVSNCTGENIICSADPRATGCIWSWSLDYEDPVTVTHISTAELLPTPVDISSTDVTSSDSSTTFADSTSTLVSSSAPAISSLPAVMALADASASPSSSFSPSSASSSVAGMIPSAEIESITSAEASFTSSAPISETESITSAEASCTSSVPASNSLPVVVALAEPSASPTEANIGGELYVGQQGGRPGEQQKTSTDWYGATSSADSAQPSSTDDWSASTSTSSSQSDWYSSAKPTSTSQDWGAQSSAWNDAKSSTSRSKTQTSAVSQPTGGISVPSGTYPAPHYVIYADRWLYKMPTATELSSFNRFILAFWMNQAGGVDNAQAWEQFDASYKQQVLDEYHAAGIALMVSAFGSTDSPTSDGADPTDVAQRLAAWVKKNGLDGVDVDYEDMTAMNTDKAEKWLITFQTELRKQLPSPYIISHAPVAPWFTSGNNYPSGAYVAVHKAVGDGIDWYNQQFYNQGHGVYEDCYSLIHDSGSQWPDTSVMQMHSYAGVPLDKIVIGKPIDANAAANGYMTGSILATCVKEAQALGWNGGVMFWEWSSSLGPSLMAIVRG